MTLPQTERLHRRDSFLTTFDAIVLAHTEVAGRPALVLDRTAFYATAGGQPNDFGALDGPPGRLDVVDVVDQGGVIAHVFGGGHAPDVGATVTGTLDFVRRFDHMCQHSGQHLLSQALQRVARAETLSVHFGPDTSTIDVDSEALDAGRLTAAEDEVNRVIAEDLRVHLHEVDEAGVAAFGLRKPPKVQGKVRIVEFEGYDFSACGGTHVRSAGQIGQVKLLKVEKRRGGSRLTFVCGGRALRRFRLLNDQALTMGALFSVAPEDVPLAVQRLMDESRETRARLAVAQERLAVFEAESFIQAGERRGDDVIVRVAFADRDAEGLRGLARQLTARPHTVALLACGGERSFLCFSRAPDAGGDMAALLRAALGALGARGGGSATFAQGGGPAASADQLRAILAGL
ncbi:MAG: alanyl-tRNA editing protein [Thermoflexales bacterium]|nr:alanyl-tRNA editing protein [Thermoflexales bacterium]